MIGLSACSSSSPVGNQLFPPATPSKTPIEPSPTQASTQKLNEKAIRKIETNLNRATQEQHFIAEAFDRSNMTEISSHANKISGLIQQIEAQDDILSRKEARTVQLLVNRLQDSAHDLEEFARAGDHEKAHAKFDSLKQDMKDLEQEVQALRTQN